MGFLCAGACEYATGRRKGWTSAGALTQRFHQARNLAAHERIADRQEVVDQAPSFRGFGETGRITARAGRFSPARLRLWREKIAGRDIQETDDLHQRGGRD